jgi:hypothetical protein
VEGVRGIPRLHDDALKRITTCSIGIVETNGQRFSLEALVLRRR